MLGAGTSNATNRHRDERCNDACSFEGLPEGASLYFFEQLENLDAAVQAIIEEGLPGTYLRESAWEPFEREEP